MQGGDISNEVSPRLVVVFEGLVGILANPKQRAAESLARKMHRWRRAVDQYEINEVMAWHIWDVVWRRKYSVDVITYLGEEFAEALEERLDRENLPVGHVWATEPHLLARSIAHMTYVAAVYDPDPAHRFTYGGKGRLLDPERPDMMGVF